MLEGEGLYRFVIRLFCMKRQWPENNLFCYAYVFTSKNSSKYSTLNIQPFHIVQVFLY